jgi:hypothetical protein
MKRQIKLLALLLLIVGFALFTRNNAHAIGRRAHPMLAAFQLHSSSSLLHILDPKPGQQLSDNAVTVRYALQDNATAETTPTFQLRLDSGDAFHVAATSYTFTGLSNGMHTVTVQVVDANGTLVPNTFNQIEFTVVPTSASQSTVMISEASTLPEPGTGTLSILGIVGFGVLVGGALSLYHARHAQSKHRRSSDL